MIGSAIAQTGDFVAALDWFQKAADIQPRSTFSLNLGLTLKELGQPDEAREHFDESIRLDPENIQARHNLAVITEELGDVEASLGLGGGCAIYYRVLTLVQISFRKSAANVRILSNVSTSNHRVIRWHSASATEYVPF